MTPTDRLYDAIVAYITTHGRSPSQPELMAATGMSRNMVWRNVNKLEAEGRIRRQSGTHRNIQLVDAPAPMPVINARITELEAALAEARRALVALAAENAMLRSENARLRAIVEREERQAEAMQQRFYAELGLSQ